MIRNTLETVDKKNNLQEFVRGNYKQLARTVCGRDEETLILRLNKQIS
jgi:hypothetical protein